MPSWVGAVVSGCSGSDDSGLPELTGSPEAPSSSPTWDQTAKPERPVDVKTQAGLADYIDYLAQVTPYTLATHDASVLAGMGDPATCVPCRNASEVGETYGDDVVLYDGPAEVDDTAITKDPAGDKWTVEAKIHLPASTRVNQKTDQEKSSADAQDLSVTYDVMWADGRWELINYATQS